MRVNYIEQKTKEFWELSMRIEGRGKAIGAGNAITIINNLYNEVATTRPLCKRILATREMVIQCKSIKPKQSKVLVFPIKTNVNAG